MSDTAVAVTLKVASVSSVVTTPEGSVLSVIPPPASRKSYVPLPSRSLGVVYENASPPAENTLP